MKAVVYEGPRDVKVKDVSDAKIEQATNVVVKITSTNICGSDFAHVRRPDEPRAGHGDRS
jgi:threonine dehydrogenase-like Zn-dependent dehydrogenase